MTGVIFAETLRRGWKTALWWGLAIGGLAFLQVIIIQDVTVIEETAALMESLPPFVIEMFGGTTDVQFLSTPDGYLALQFFGFILLVFAFYSVIAGLNVTSNDEEAGILDEFLSLPIKRWVLIIEKALAYVVLTALLLLITAVFLLIGIAMVPDIQYNVPAMMLATANLLPSMVLVLSFTILAAAIFRRRNAAIALSAAFVVGSYFLDVFSKAAPDTILSRIELFSFFNYYDSTEVIRNGLQPLSIGILLSASIVFILLAVWRFQRRDVGV